MWDIMKACKGSDNFVESEADAVIATIDIP